MNKSTVFRQTVKFFTAVFFILISSFSIAFGQKWEIGVGLGANMYRGELAPSFKPWQSRLGGEALIRYNISPTIALRLNALLAGVHGSDHGSTSAMAEVRNAEFSNTIFEFSYLTEYNFLDYRKDARYFETCGRFTPYLAFGIGVFTFRDYPDTPNSGINTCIPLGVGFKWAISKQANVGIESLYRFTFTDQLDNAYYKSSNPAQIAYTNDTDAYLFVSAKFTWTFYRIVCAQDIQK